MRTTYEIGIAVSRTEVVRLFDPAICPRITGPNIFMELNHESFERAKAEAVWFNSHYRKYHSVAALLDGLPEYTGEWGEHFPYACVIQTHDYSDHPFYADREWDTVVFGVNSMMGKAVGEAGAVYDLESAQDNE